MDVTHEDTIGEPAGAEEFQRLSRRTWGTDFHSSLTRGWELMNDVQKAADFLDGTLDEHKRALFYGDDSANVLRNTPGDDHILDSLGEEGEQHVHAALGVATEAGEIMEEVLAALSPDTDVDRQALIEEAGDVLYYLARIADLTGSSLLEMMQANHRKLAERFPEQFTPEDALERDTDAEAEALA